MNLTRPFSLAVALWLAGAPAALAGSATGSVALALAGVVAAHSPKLSPAEKKAVAAFFDGKTDVPYTTKIKVAADKIVCRIGNVDITARSCEVTFAGETIAFETRHRRQDGTMASQNSPARSIPQGLGTRAAAARSAATRQTSGWSCDGRSRTAPSLDRPA